MDRGSTPLISTQAHAIAYKSRVFGWGCTGFDKANDGVQATRQAIDVNEANPQTPTISVSHWPLKVYAEAA